MFGNVENGFLVIKEYFIATIADIISKHNLNQNIIMFSLYRRQDKSRYFRVFREYRLFVFINPFIWTLNMIQYVYKKEQGEKHYER